MPYLVFAQPLGLIPLGISGLACANISFRKGWAYATEADQPRWTMYPDPEQREPFTAVALLPANVAKLYRETLQAIAGRCFTLAAGGMRAVVEAICQLHGCKGQDLQQKISKLKGNNGVLGTREATALHSHRIFGNEAMHRMRQPSPTEIYEALEILEHVLRTLYELPYRADNLARMRAERILCEVTNTAAQVALVANNVDTTLKYGHTEDGCSCSV